MARFLHEQSILLIPVVALHENEMVGKCCILPIYHEQLLLALICRWSKTFLNFTEHDFFYVIYEKTVIFNKLFIFLTFFTMKGHYSGMNFCFHSHRTTQSHLSLWKNQKLWRYSGQFFTVINTTVGFDGEPTYEYAIPSTKWNYDWHFSIFCINKGGQQICPSVC